MNFLYSKIRDVKTPIRSTVGSAGIDFFVPKIDDKFINDYLQKNDSFYVYIDEKTLEKGFFIGSRQKILIPSGIKISIPENTSLIAFNKSGISTEKGLIKLAEVIDSDYQGEIYFSIYNTDSVSHIILENTKLIQFLLIPIFSVDLEEVQEKNLYSTESKRGQNGFGSTGKL